MKERSLYLNDNECAKTKICMCLITMLFSLIFVAYICNQDNKANNIYYSSVENIVELKVSSKAVGDSYGTAVFLDNDGILVTNMHAVTYTKNGEARLYDQLQIRFPTDEEYRDVTFVKYDEELDIAVLKFELCDIKIKGIELGDSDKIDYGDKVYSIGNTMNYGISISQGIISVPNIEVNYDNVSREVIQSDINISSGNSGGALLDINGRLVGITSFRVKEPSGDIVYGIGYSIPINKVIDYVYG